MTSLNIATDGLIYNPTSISIATRGLIQVAVEGMTGLSGGFYLKRLKLIDVHKDDEEILGIVISTILSGVLD